MGAACALIAAGCSDLWLSLRAEQPPLKQGDSKVTGPGPQVAAESSQRHPLPRCVSAMQLADLHDASLEHAPCLTRNHWQCVPLCSCIILENTETSREAHTRLP